MQKHKLSESIRSEGLPPQSRIAQVVEGSINEEARTATFSFSSEYEVRRYWGTEILGHQSHEVDMARMEGGPFLMDHDRWDQRGVIERAWIEGSKGYCDVRFSRSEKGEELWVDVKDGIRRNVSVNYRINELTLLERTNDDEKYRVTSWEPLEISSVSVPADPSVGVGRSDATDLQTITFRGETPMDDDQTLETPTAPPVAPIAPARAAETAPAPVVTTPAAEPARSGPTDAQMIAKTAAEYGAQELGNRAIADGKTFEDFRSDLLKDLKGKRSERPTESTAMELDIPESDLRNYSLVGAIRAAATGNWKGAGLEQEISNTLAERMDKEAGGVFVPYEVLGHGLRQQSAGGAGKGAELVATNLHSEAFIEALRSRAVMASLGARFMTGLIGNVDIPKQTGTSTFYWLGEDGEPTDSDVDFGTVQMRPNTIAGAVPMTRRLLMQSSPQIEGLIRDDLLSGLALGLDAALLKGTGVGNEPTGIINTSGIGSVDLTGGVTWAKILEMEADVAEANADADGMAYIMRPTMRQVLKSTEKASSTGKFIWEDGMVNDYRAAVTTQMVPNDILFGDFSQAMMGLWGALDLVPDKSTKAKSGGLVLRVFQDADVAVRHPTAFSYADLP